MQQRSDVSSIALNVYEDEDVLEIYINDLLDPKLNFGTIEIDSVSTPGPVFRKILFEEIFATIDPVYWDFENEGVDAETEAKYVSDAADLLSKVTEGFLGKRLLFSDPIEAEGPDSNAFDFLGMINQQFLNVVRRTNDARTKQRLLETLETLRGSQPTEPGQVATVRHA